MDTRETIRLALLYAIDDRRYFLECLGEYNEDGMKDRTVEQIKAFKKVYKRRYGELFDPTADCELVSVFDSDLGKFRKF